MSRSRIKVLLPVLIGLMIGVVCMWTVQDSKQVQAKSAEATKGKHKRRNVMPCKDGQRFIVTIESDDFSVAQIPPFPCALFNAGGVNISDWTYVNSKQDTTKKKITIVYTAVVPNLIFFDKDGKKTTVGTGTIVITTSDGTNTSTTVPPIDVETTDLDTCP
jgi:hypothetical protein